MATKTLMTVKSKNRRVRKYVPKVDTTQARSNMEVLRKCLKQLRWEECFARSSAVPDIYWNSGDFQEGNRDYASTTARVNKFPGMRDIMCKINLSRSLNVMRKLFPDEFDFYPNTWFLPEQQDQFHQEAQIIHKKDRKQRRRLTTFIVKPSDGSEGAGIYLIQDPTRCTIMNRPHIVQEYIDRPLLMDGLKFDVRIYVVILQLDPLKILLYDEGLARFATVNYQAPSTKNLHEAFMHLTNYSLNKRSANYKHASDDTQTDASKRKFSLVWAQLSNIFDPDEIERAQELIEEMINKTVIAILPELRIQYAFELSASGKQNRCFQIIGFDVLLTDQLKPILLEVNANPSLRIDFDHVNETGKFICEPSPIDEDIKRPLVLETLKLVMREKNSSAMKNEIPTKSKGRKRQQLGQSGSRSPSCSSEEDIDEDQEYRVASTCLTNTINTEKEPQGSSENKENIAAGSNFVDEKSLVHAVEEKSVIQSSMNSMPTSLNLPITTGSKKSLKLIFPSMSEDKYEHLFILEKIAFIFIEFVVKRGYKSMTNWPFRNFINICGLSDESTARSSIDMLYAQIFHKCKQYASQSPATGLDFSGFIEAFFLLAQRKYSTAETIFDSVTELVDTCMARLNPSINESD